MFTSTTTPDGRKVGIGLFGWTSSAAPDVERFVYEQAGRDDGSLSRVELAQVALDAAHAQGVPESHDGRSYRGWNRAFAFGDALDVAEWLVQVYADYSPDELDALEDGRRRPWWRRRWLG